MTAVAMLITGLTLTAPAARAVTTITPSANSVNASAGTAITPVTMAPTGAAGTVTYVADVLPAGLVIDSGSGTITGTPTAAGSTTTIVTATDAGDSSTQTATITFAVAPALTASASSVTGAVGAVLAGYTLTPVGFTPTTFTKDCTLPAGLVFDTTTGLVAGTPENSFSGPCTITGSDGTLSASTTAISLSVAGPSFTTPTQVVQGVVGAPLASTSFGASNFFGLVGYALDAASPALPAGFTLDAATGLITGSSVTAVPPTTVIVKATDAAVAANSLTASVQIIVDDATLAPASQSVVGLVGAPITKTQTLVPTGLAASPVFTVAPALPAGLSINAATGVVSGTPAVASPKATYLITATDSLSKVATSLLDVTVDAPLGAAQVVKGTVGSPLATDVLTAAVTAPATPLQSYAVTPVLPLGLSIDVETGSITGTPTEAIPLTVFTITKSDVSVPAKQLGATTLSLTIDGTLAPASQVIYGELGRVLTGVRLFPAGMTSPVTMTIDPAIPAELTFNATSGVLSGTPVSPYAPTTYTVTATDANGAVATAQINLTVTKVQLLKPVIGAVKAGTTPGSLIVFFARPFFTPLGHEFIVELYDTSWNLVKTKPTTTSPVQFTGLVPGATYTAIVVSPETATHSRVESLPVSGVAAPGKADEPIVFSSVSVSTPMAGTASWRDSRVQLASASQARGARRFVLKQRTARILASSPTVRIPKGIVAKIVIPWSGSKAAQDIRIKSGRVWLLLGRVKPSGSRLTTPAFRIVKPGTYPILVGSSGSVASFFKVIVSGGKA